MFLLYRIPTESRHCYLSREGQVHKNLNNRCEPELLCNQGSKSVTQKTCRKLMMWKFKIPCHHCVSLPQNRALLITWLKDGLGRDSPIFFCSPCAINSNTEHVAGVCHRAVTSLCQSVTRVSHISSCVSTYEYRFPKNIQNMFEQPMFVLQPSTNQISKTSSNNGWEQMTNYILR